MARRRAGNHLPIERFIAYITRPDISHRVLGNSYVFGVERDGIFIPTHFSPATEREGYKLIKELAKDKTAFFVTLDLIPMLKKAGFTILPKEIKTTFRDEEVIKKAAVSKKRLIPTLLKWLISYERGDGDILLTSEEFDYWAHYGAVHKEISEDSELYNHCVEVSAKYGETYYNEYVDNDWEDVDDEDFPVEDIQN
jgi:hypothetical protein